MDGILIVYKEKGYTSHDVVAKLRGILRQRKIGHTGTLDPQAEGVLPVCLGNATKLCDMLTDRNKSYKAGVRLGVETDTQDIFGQAIKQTECLVTEQQVTETAESFIGEYDQIPPMYSAKKINGKKLYELARQGKEVERKPCRIHINSIQVEKIQLPDIQLTVDCSKGTYIRTLCHDIGQKLGCGACMTSLLRTKVGNFSLKQALTLDQIEKKREDGTLEKWIIPVEEAFLQHPAIVVKTETERFLMNGNRLKLDDLQEGAPKAEIVRVLDSHGQFQAVYGWDSEKNDFKPIKMFLRSDV